MSAILESFLDDERRADCRANDGAMATGQPIIGSQPTIHPERASRLHRTINRVITAGPYAPRIKTVSLAQLWLDRHPGKDDARTLRHHAEPARSERSDAARGATNELW